MGQSKNVLLICGGGGTEHEISLISAKYITSKLSLIPEVKIIYLCIEKDGRRTNEINQECELRKAGEVFNRETQKTISLDYAIPCIHGPPGENGQIQAVFELMGLPYLGADPEASINCFNKVSTKLWLDKLGIKNTEYVFVRDSTDSSVEKIFNFFEKNKKDIFLKATHQGSSVGCYHITEENQIKENLHKALELSPIVLAEKTNIGRELEVAAFEYQNELIITPPGEIDCPESFYSYKEKYNSDSKTETRAIAKNIDNQTIAKISEMASNAFIGLGLKDLARIDFFLLEDNTPLINEINTFPGHTPISMFPLMMENSGVKYEEYLRNRIFNS